MASPKYPLKPLLEHRARKVDDATAELGDAIRTREGAEQARARAEQTKREAEERAAKVKADEAERLMRGELRAVDLARGEAWEIGARSEIHQLTRAVDKASHVEAKAKDEETGARSHLAGTMADRDVVAKDQTRFDERLKKKIESAEELEAEDVFRGGSEGGRK